MAVVAAAVIYKEAIASEAFYEREARQNAETYRQTASEHAQRSCAGIIPAERYECIHREHHEARDRQRQERDLQAQLVTSAWTRAMGIAAIIGMFVGIIGIGLIYATFDATKEANRIAKGEAERSANEAEAARKNLIYTERAILHIEHVNVSFDETGKEMGLTLNIENRGKSNAWNLRIGTGQRKSRRYPTRFTEHQPSSLIVNPGVRAKTNRVTIAAPSAYPIWVFGYLTYTTAHEATFHSYFCVRLDGVPGDDGYGGLINYPVDARHEVELPANT